MFESMRKSHTKETTVGLSKLEFYYHGLSEHVADEFVEFIWVSTAAMVRVTM